jgi:GDP-4-dehydro-6-deoxy-D-mannose reductase
MRAFVTGAAGFAGSYLTELLLAHGAEVFGLVLDRSDVGNLEAALTGAWAARLHLVEGDLLAGAPLVDALRAIHPEQVYHLAAAASVRQSLTDPRETFRANVLGTHGLLEAVRQTALRPRILCVSSAEAYGESSREPTPLSEDRSLLPVTPYGSSKAAVEQVACRYTTDYDLDIVRVRPFPHTGPRQSPQFALPDWARQLAEIEAGRRPPRLLVGNLEVRRDLADVRDVVIAYGAALARGETGAVYNVCSGRVLSLREVLAILTGLATLSVAVIQESDRQRSQDIDVLAGSYRALRLRAGWEPTIPLERTLRDLLAYWRDRTSRGQDRTSEPLP